MNGICIGTWFWGCDIFRQNTRKKSKARCISLLKSTRCLCRSCSDLLWRHCRQYWFCKLIFGRGYVGVEWILGENRWNCREGEVFSRACWLAWVAREIMWLGKIFFSFFLFQRRLFLENIFYFCCAVKHFIIFAVIKSPPPPKLAALLIELDDCSRAL